MTEDMIKNKLSIFLVLVIVLLGVSLIAEKNSCNAIVAQIESIPSFDLVNSQFELDPNSAYENDYAVKATGFVAFLELDKQPLKARQYYILDTDFSVEPSNELVRKFTVKEIIKMEYLPPKEISTEVLAVKRETDSVLILEDKFENVFTVNKLTEEITLEDSNGDRVKLITTNSEYQKFIKELLRRK